MDTMVIQNLQEYIKAEMGDSELYKELAKMAPDDEDRKLLLEFSEDEQTHANTFKRIYRMLTNRNYNPVIAPPILTLPYEDILRDRVIDESGDFRKYGEQYLQTDRPNILKEAYYIARTDENVHALRLLDMLSKQRS